MKVDCRRHLGKSGDIGVFQKFVRVKFENIARN